MGEFTKSFFNTIKEGYESIGEMTGRGTAAVQASSGTAETIFNGPNSLARMLFESSNDTAAWYKMVIGKDTNDAWRLSGARVAGAGVGLSATGRILSGGGIYKDGDGNTDIIGIPFI